MKVLQIILQITLKILVIVLIAFIIFIPFAIIKAAKITNDIKDTTGYTSCYRQGNLYSNSITFHCSKVDKWEQKVCDNYFEYDFDKKLIIEKRLEDGCALK